MQGRLPRSVLTRRIWFLLIRVLRLIFRKAEVSVECWHFCVGQQQIYDDIWQIWRHRTILLVGSCKTARPHPTQPTSFACWWSSNFSSSLSCSAGSATCEWNTCFLGETADLRGVLEDPGLMDEGCRNHTANPILAGWAVHPSETLSTHEIPLAIVAEEEHGALLSLHTCERSVPATTTREMSSTSLLSWIHEIWSISTAGPISTSTILTSGMTKRGKCHCTVAGTPQKIWSYPLQRAAKHPGGAAFQERVWQTLPKTSTLYKSFSGNIPLNKMPDISE